jgi:thiamine-monophosphate kinase
MNENSGQDLTPLSELGEFGFIERIAKDFPTKRESVLKGIGDDAAVYEVGKGEVHVVSTDLLAEGVHFDLAYVPLKHLGYKSVAVNLSDIFAMNCDPFGITVSVAMSNRFTVQAMDAFYAGVLLACERYGVDLLGGDTSSSRTGLVISVTAIGKGKKDDVVYRDGAKENDLICLTGDIGGAYAGLQVLETGEVSFPEKSEYPAGPGRI